MAGRIEIYARDGVGNSVSIEGVTADDQSRLVTAIAVVTRVNGIEARGEFQIKQIEFPEAVLDGRKLKRWDQLQTAIRQAREAADQALASLEAARDDIRARLAAIKVDLNAQAGGFLGINALPFAAQAEARLCIDLTLLDPAAQDDAAVLTATIAGSAVLGDRGATMRIEVTVTREALVRALPAISIDAPAPGLPALDLVWPRIGWPQLSFPQLHLPDLSQILRFGLPLPQLDSAQPPLRVRWPGTAPQMSLAVADRRLRIDSGAPSDGVLELATDAKTVRLADITGFRFALEDGNLTLQGRVDNTTTDSIDLPAKAIDSDFLPVTVDLAPSTLQLALQGSFDLGTAAGPGDFGLTATLILPRVVLKAKSDPALLLALKASYEQRYDAVANTSSGRLTSLEVIEPYPVALVVALTQGAATAAQDLLRLICALPLPTMGAPQLPNLVKVIERIAEMLAAAIRWLAAKAGAAIESLLAVGQAIGEALARFVRFLVESFRKLQLQAGAAVPHLTVEIGLDAHSHRLRRIVVSRTPTAVQDASPTLTAEALGLELRIPLDWTAALVIDFDEPMQLALVAMPSTNSPVVLGTDLWLSDDAGLDAARDTTKEGTRAPDRLLQVEASLAGATSALAIATISQSKARVLQILSGTAGNPVLRPLQTSLGTQLSVVHVDERLALADIDTWNAYKIEAKLASDAADRLLPFLQSSKGSTPGGGFLESLQQYIHLRPGTPVVAAASYEVTLPIQATLVIAKTKADFTLDAILDLKALNVRLKGGQQVVINGPEDKDFNLFGLQGKLTPAASKAKFVLDFSGGDVRLALAPGAKLELCYAKVASAGRGIVFIVDAFALSRAGLDLDARVDPATPVQLAGVDMPFRFSRGSLSIKRGEIQSFAIAGAGQLPPELVGEANASIAIALGRGANGALSVLSAEATLDKSNDPIVCHGTRFTLTLSAIGLEFQDFAAEGAGYHFYFTLTGTAEFRPRPGEFTDGLLKHFGGLTITLDKAPLARDASLLARAIEFQVTVEPKKRFNVFNLFTFELRGIGFHPASPAFGGQPAMSISGQVNFVEAGDIVSPKFDFHKLWLAPPKSGQSLPQVRFDGLTVGVRFGGSASIEGTAIAVDDSLPSLYRPGALPANVTVRGFLGSGRLSIKGWGSMSAAMGFLELARPGRDPRLAFFLYAQRNELSIEIPTPVGPIYLREVGFGFGFRFTLAAFNRADQVDSVKKLVEVLDEVSKYQGDLASVEAWEPEADGNRLTLALRGLITIETASSEDSYNPRGEKELPNPVMFDIVAAMRSDLTFFLNGRVWISRNYADWHDSSAQDSWRRNPILRGYMYLSVPRQEFLARMVSDGKGDLEGKHPELPRPLVQAMRGIRWSATTYIRPGLFHQEFGWPYELGFSLSQGDTFRIDCEGGLVNRIEDGALLYGIAFRARGFARFGGSVGGRSFGASVVARADFSIDAKLISYISAKRFRDSLFYGSLAFSVSIGLEVRVWLEFSVGFADIHLEVGFSLSITITVALELAVKPNAIGGRGSASVGVGAFGRSLRLGIGFGFNEGFLAEARTRVDRFLSLGLAAALPDAEKGVAPPPAELPRSPRAVAADQAVERALDKHETVTAPPPPGDPPGRQLQPSAYWAMLFPVAGNASVEQYVMILVPRDHSETGVAETDLPRSTPAGGDFGTFYPPPGNSAPLTITLPDGLTVKRLLPGGRLEDLAGHDQPLPYANDAVIFRPSGAQEVKLSDFMKQCFIKGAGGLLEPVGRRIDAVTQPLPESREAAAQMLAEAGRDQLALNEPQRLANEIEERRSAAVAALCESAAKLAAGGAAAWDARVGETLDIRQLGVAFVVTGDQIDKLFAAPNGAPRKARFTLTATAIAGDTPVHLFNGPERMFREAGPKLADPVIEEAGASMRLDWDLEPAFGKSTGVWDDPEFSLKHYRIERQIVVDGGLVTAQPARRTTVKAAAPIRLVWNQDTGGMTWQFLRPQAQFVDDFSDVPAADLATYRSRRATVRYTVVPVDCAGTAGMPTVLEKAFTAPPLAVKPVLRGVIGFAYDTVGNPDGAIVRPRVTLGLEDGEDTKRDAPKERIYVLRVRREAGAPIGLYGADAVTEARVRPSPADFDQKHADDEDFELILRTGPPAIDEEQQVGDPAGYVFADPARGLESFLAVIGVLRSGAQRADDGAVGARFAVRRKVDGEQPAWCPLDITMLFKPEPQAGVGDRRRPLPPVAVPIEVFEHPVRLDVAPLMGEDIDGAAGRVLVWHPPARGRLDKYLDLVAGGPPVADEQPVRLRDPERRVATRIRWNALPAGIDELADLSKTSAQRLARLFGGFDLFETDVAGEVEGATSAPTAAAIRYSFGTRTVDADPGARKLCLDHADPSKVRAMFVSPLDFAGTDRANVLDLMDGTTENATARLVLIKKSDPGSRLSFRLDVRVRANNYRRLRVVSADPEGTPLPFANNDEVILVYVRDGTARHVARVQALPPSMKLLEPAEVADFAKVEARYPSETRRLVVPEDLPRPAGRRRPWYSPAESFVAWPSRPWRRSLAINVDETVVTQLLSQGRPRLIKVELKIDGVATVSPSWRPLVGDETPQGGGFAPPEGQGWTVRHLRALFQGLVWSGGGNVKKEAAREARIAVRALNSTGTTLTEAEWGVDLDPALHPVLADVIDWIRYDAAGDTRYRRYEPVLEGLPKLGATDVPGWLDETPEARDPYGWSILRKLGLAAGVKLYDTEIRDYLPPEQALRRLNDAFAVILPRYANLELGAPFVDIVTRPGGTLQVASFEGEPPANADAMRGIVKAEGVALAQISLRPVADRLAAPADLPVAYFQIRKSADNVSTVGIKVRTFCQPSIAVVDVLDLTSGLAKSQLRTLATEALNDGAKKLRADLTDDAGEDYSVEIPVAGLSTEEVIALVRVTVAGGDASALFENGNVLEGGVARRVPNPLGPAPDPFGRFPEMSPRRFAALLANHGSLENTAGFRPHADRSWPGGWPAEASADAQLQLRLAGWMRRFLEHGRGDLPPQDAPASTVYFSFAEVTRPDPWRVGVATDGTMQIILTHDDRKRRLKRYAIKPFGRYESFVEAVQLAARPNQRPQSPQLGGAWSDGVLGQADVTQAYAALERAWARRFFDTVIPRTEPLAPPLVIDAKRMEILPPATSNIPPRRVVEFLYARHPEELMSEANVTVEGALSFEGVSVGLWREFAAQRWARDLKPGIDTAAGFGGLSHRPQAQPLIASDDRFGGLAQTRQLETGQPETGQPDDTLHEGRYIDGWRGALALRTEWLPHFFRTHAVAFAAAGVVVSKPVVATVEEGHHDLCLPWRTDILGQTADQVTPLQTTPDPTWTVTRDDAGQGFAVRFTLPLVRFVDCMPPAMRKDWLDRSSIPALFTLPDPAARYEIGTVAEDGSGMIATAAELDVIAEQRGADSGSPTSKYRANTVGPLFARTMEPVIEEQSNGQVWWRLGVTTTLDDPRPAPPDATFAPHVPAEVAMGGNQADPLRSFELSATAFSAAIWSSVTPTADVTLRIMAPQPGNAQFRADLTTWRDLFAPHADTGNAAATAARNFLQSWIDTDGITPPLPQLTLSIGAFSAGLPRIAFGRPAAVAIEQSAVWQWPQPPACGIAVRDAVAGLTASHLADQFTPESFTASVLAPIRDELRRLSIARKLSEFREWRSLASTLPVTLREAALTMGLAQSGNVQLLPDTADVIAVVSIAGGSTTIDSWKRLIEAIEAAPFTATAITDLAPFEDADTVADRIYRLRLPCRALLSPQVAAALAGLDADPAWRADCLVLRAPPDDNDWAKVRNALAAVAPTDLRDHLQAYVETAVAAQIFGPGRKPRLKAYRGRALPLADLIVRAQ
ncbi:MAG: hypothetical protein HYX38_26740 [Rhodospirillales bacterium]|nr:hypothetical protein [Rhodospirillales bacterium]